MASAIAFSAHTTISALSVYTTKKEILIVN